jgi:uncharacterized protein (TIGR02001 family)
MIKSRILLAGALLAVCGAASADITVTPAVVWDYDFRGVSQTAGDPALQAGITYTHASGAYVGAWASNVQFGPGDPNVEMDFFGGFAGGDATKSVGYDVGIIYYTYVSASGLNYPEIYAGITKGWFNVKLSYSWDWGGSDRPSFVSGTAYYLEGNATIPLPAGFTGLAHIGWSDGSYWSDAYGNGYVDWAVGASHAFGHFTGTLKYIDGSDLPDGGSKFFKTDGKAWVGFQTTLPWK